MTSVVDRFIKYVQINTQSNEFSESVPSSTGQWDLARILLDELHEMGVTNAVLTPQCYVYAFMPANTRKRVSSVGFIAHLDTSPDEKGDGVKPKFKKDKKGNDIITSDGTTLLGADDKSGIAAIMSAIEYFTENPQVKHGDVYIAFTPDEEIGRGTDHFDRSIFKADFAYTVDGGEAGELEIENFNAAKAVIKITGKPCHPGYAKNKMVNASILASKVIDVICSENIPENSEGRQGFFHITHLEGNVGSATVEFIIREFDQLEFNYKKRFANYLAEGLNEQFGKGTATVEITDQYRNMFDIISQYPDIVQLAKNSMTEAGVEPKLTPIRGGTDGVKLCFDGLPCPNLFAGGINFHSKDEYIPVKSLYMAQDTVINIIKNVILSNICIKNQN